MPGGYEWIVILAVMPIAILLNVLIVLPFWKICTKAGFPGALSLLMIVPIANIVLPFYIAFAEWPTLRNSQGHGQ
jgi:hypothetical protein